MQGLCKSPHIMRIIHCTVRWLSCSAYGMGTIIRPLRQKTHLPCVPPNSYFVMCGTCPYAHFSLLAAYVASMRPGCWLRKYNRHRYETTFLGIGICPHTADRGWRDWRYFGAVAEGHLFRHVQPWAYGMCLCSRSCWSSLTLLSLLRVLGRQ